MQDIISGLARKRQRGLHVFRAALDSASPAEVSKEAELMWNAETAAAAIDAVHNRSYLTLKSGDRAPKIPGAEIMLVGCTKDGAPATAVVVMSFKEYPKLKELKLYRDAARRAAAHTHIQEFNTQPLADRKAALERYLSLMASASASDWSPDDVAFMKRLKPAGVGLDQKTFSLRLQRRK